MKQAQKLLFRTTTALALIASLSAHANDTGEIKWPDPKSAWLNNGTFIDVEQLGRIGPGMNKDQVRELISYPQFSEGFFHPRQWNYLFNFRTGQGHDYVTCQYQVVFDKNQEVQSMHWREQDCAKYLSTKQIVIQTHPISISSDGLFAFGRSGLNDLQEGGRENLANLAGQIKNGFSTLRSVDIIGHTDRIGNAASNMTLSIARANTVKQYLVSQGIDGGKIRTQGMGSNKPVAFCSGAVTPAVIACLMPNRRIEISVSGDK